MSAGVVAAGARRRTAPAATHIGAQYGGAAFGAASVSVTVPDNAGSAVGDTVFFVAASYTASVWDNDTGHLTKHGSESNGCVLFTRVITGSENSSYTFTRTGTISSHPAVYAFRRSNEGAVTSVAVSTAAGSGSLTLPSVTTATNGATMLQVAMKLAPAGGAWSTSAGGVERDERSVSGGFGYTAAYGDQTIAVAGATGTRLWSVNNSTGNSRGISIAVNRP